MSAKARRWVAVITLLISVGGMIAFTILEARSGSRDWRQDPVGETLLGLAFVMFPLVGALIVTRQPGNLVGWIFSAIGLVTGVGGAAQAYATESLAGRTQAGMIESLAAWIANWWWYPLLGLIIVMTLFLFPTGRLPSRRWRFFFWLGVLSVAFGTFIAMTSPRLSASAPSSDRLLYDIDNPFGVGGLGDPEEGTLGGLIFSLAGIASVAAAISLIVRFVRSRGVERQQLKWFALAGTLTPLNMLLEEVLPVAIFSGSSALFAIGVGALPVAAGIAILRYRLYDIDLVINRALVYGLLTAILGAAHVGIVFGLQAALAPATAESDLAIAASTLAVAALFRPVRARVQEFIDRRFYRRKFDAQRTIEEFNSHLRDEVELAAVRSKLVDVVADTVQPTQVSLWLRSAESIR